MAEAHIPHKVNKMNSERFIKTYAQGRMSPFEIWVDKETGVNYLFHSNGSSGGLTILVDKNGKPIVSPTLDYKFDKI